jgi:hypothetical protein
MKKHGMQNGWSGIEGLIPPQMGRKSTFGPARSCTIPDSWNGIPKLREGKCGMSLIRKQDELLDGPEMEFESQSHRDSTRK